jgi:hypothetical protein
MTASAAEPLHVPSPSLRSQVETMAGLGAPESGIARMLGIDPKTLREHYAGELEDGVMKANTRVAESLYRRATCEGREAVGAAIFWLKARAGWRETSTHELAGRDGQPIRIEISGVDAML